MRSRHKDLTRRYKDLTSQHDYLTNGGTITNTVINVKSTHALLMSAFLGHLSHSGDLLLWIGVRRRPSCGVRRP